ncbi:hypothetical protein [Rubripirellula amarantea]|uniref:hypothetical protein n=1 Tax=Rubripirellula amarantea TaxID=2527999 RepID=UPI0013EEF340|nr:hypothetical protein [Rubripirellula amarantea]
MNDSSNDGYGNESENGQQSRLVHASFQFARRFFQGARNERESRRGISSIVRIEPGRRLT